MTNRTSEPNLADYIEKWSKKYLAPSAQEMGAREEYTADLARYLRGEIKRLESQQAMRPASTSSNHRCTHFAPPQPTATQGTATIGPFICPWCEIERLQKELYAAQGSLAALRLEKHGGIRPVETSRDDARDAARYRYLRERLACDRLAARKLVITTEGGREPYRTLREAELDREIDECIGLSVEPSENPERNSASQGYPQVDPRHEVSDSVAAKVGAAVVGSETIGSEKASAPLDREAVNALALQCAQASAVVRNREWNFDRYRNGKLKAQGVTVHAATEAEAWEKARSLLHIDGNMPTDELRLQPLNGSPVISENDNG